VRKRRAGWRARYERVAALAKATEPEPAISVGCGGIGRCHLLAGRGKRDTREGGRGSLITQHDAGQHAAHVHGQRDTGSRRDRYVRPRGSVFCVTGEQCDRATGEILENEATIGVCYGSVFGGGQRREQGFELSSGGLPFPPGYRDAGNWLPGTGQQNSSRHDGAPTHRHGDFFGRRYNRNRNLRRLITWSAHPEGARARGEPPQFERPIVSVKGPRAGRAEPKRLGPRRPNDAFDGEIGERLQRGCVEDAATQDGSHGQLDRDAAGGHADFRLS